MGWVYFRLGRLKLAEEFLARAIAGLPDQAIMYDHLGDVYLQQGRPDDAIGQWREALRLDPDNDEVRRKLDHHRP
jgi:tetratricopeptide (TPR) repeat protein